MLKKLLINDISKMCDMEMVREDGKIMLNGKLYEIYEVLPINIMTDEPNNCKEIYDTYVSFLRNVSNDIKIYITKRPKTFNNEIKLYKDKMLETEETGLKKAINGYIDYLEGLDKNRDVYNTHYYIITRVDEKSKDLEILLDELKKIGLIIERVTSKEISEQVFKGAAQ